jgi:hypothetical protein
MDSTRFVPLGYAQLTSAIASSAAGLTVPPGATMVLLQAEAQAVRFRDDGAAPSASVGMLIPVGAPLEYTGTLTALQFIAEDSGAILNVSFYRAAG